jgi:hypothetical protein
MFMPSKEEQGRNLDCRVRLHALTPPGVESTSLKEPCGAYPRKCSFIHLSIEPIYNEIPMIIGTSPGDSDIVTQ